MCLCVSDGNLAKISKTELSHRAKCMAHKLKPKTVTKLVLCAEIHSLNRKSSNIGSFNREKNNKKKYKQKNLYKKKKRASK